MSRRSSAPQRTMPVPLEPTADLPALQKQLNIEVMNVNDTCLPGLHDDNGDLYTIDITDNAVVCRSQNKKDIEKTALKHSSWQLLGALVCSSTFVELTCSFAPPFDD